MDKRRKCKICGHEGFFIDVHQMELHGLGFKCMNCGDYEWSGKLAKTKQAQETQKTINRLMEI